jgi:hypothetical protein
VPTEEDEENEPFIDDHDSDGSDGYMTMTMAVVMAIARLTI